MKSMAVVKKVITVVGWCVVFVFASFDSWRAFFDLVRALPSICSSVFEQMREADDCYRLAGVFLAGIFAGCCLTHLWVWFGRLKSMIAGIGIGLGGFLVCVTAYVIISEQMGEADFGRLFRIFRYGVLIGWLLALLWVCLAALWKWIRGLREKRKMGKAQIASSGAEPVEKARK